MARFVGMILLLVAGPKAAYAQSDSGGAPLGAQDVVLNHGVSLDEGVPARPEDGKLAPTMEPTTAPHVPDTTVRRSRPARSVSEAMRRADAVTTPWYRSGLGALAVVLAIVGLLAWVIRRWLPSTRLTDAGGLRVVGRASVTPKHSVVLLRVGRRYVLVGVSGERMTPLSEVSDPDEVAELTRQTGVSGADAFDRVLLKEATIYGESDEDEPDAIGSSSTESRRPLNDLLKRLKSLQKA